MYLVAVMLSSYIDCKTVSFFLKISKEIGKAWRKSLAREGREPHTPVFSLVAYLLFDYSGVLEYAKLRTVLQSTSNKARAFYIMHSLFNFFFLIY